MKKHFKFVLPFVLLVSPLAVTSCGNSSESVDNISYTVKKEPTCLEAGLEEGYDKDGNLISRPIPALGHNYDSGVVTLEPTCEEKGVKTFACSRCHDTYTEDIDALGHTISSEYLYDPSTHYNECTRCHKHFNEHTHNFQYKKSTNVKPVDYFPYGYSEASFNITWGKDENLEKTMGVINEYSCPTCNATLYKAEFLTSYVYPNGSKTKETHYTYDDYKITKVEDGIYEAGVLVDGCIYDFTYDDSKMVVIGTYTSKSKDPYIYQKYTYYVTDHKTDRIEMIKYDSGNESVYVDYDFTYDDSGNITDINELEHYPNSESKSTTKTHFLVCDFRINEYKDLNRRFEYSDGSWYEFTTTYNEKKQRLTYRSESYKGTSDYTVQTYTYDSDGRLIKLETKIASGTTDVIIREYTGNSYNEYKNGVLAYSYTMDDNNVLLHSIGYIGTYSNREYERITSECYENENEIVVSSKVTDRHVEDEYKKWDNTTYTYVKKNYSDKRLVKDYTKITVDSVNPDQYDEYVSEQTYEYTYNARGKVSRINNQYKKDYVKESETDYSSSSSYEYIYTEFPISMNILDR